MAREKWTTRQAADHAGIAPATFRAYVARHYAPPPIEGEFGPSGQRWYWADEITRWHANRPGNTNPH